MNCNDTLQRCLHVSNLTSDCASLHACILDIRPALQRMQRHSPKTSLTHRTWSKRSLSAGIGQEGNDGPWTMGSAEANLNYITCITHLTSSFEFSWIILCRGWWGSLTSSTYLEPPEDSTTMWQICADRISRQIQAGLKHPQAFLYFWIFSIDSIDIGLFNMVINHVTVCIVCWFCCTRPRKKMDKWYLTIACG